MSVSDMMAASTADIQRFLHRSVEKQGFVEVDAVERTGEMASTPGQSQRLIVWLHHASQKWLISANGNWPVDVA